MASVLVPAPRLQQEMELAAFEKGRLQGELEATRRLEAENLHREKVLLPAEGALPLQTELVRPDVVEINRLTWLQRLSGVVGVGCNVAQLIMTIVWVEQYRGNLGWSNSGGSGDIDFYNTHYVTNCLGLFFLANAITNYRMGPLNIRPMINRAWYVFLQMATITCFTLSLVSIIRSTPEDRLWGVWGWVFVMAYSVVMLHSLYSIISTCLEPMHHRKMALGGNNYGAWSETGTHLETPEQRRDHSAYNHAARTLYAPAPVTIHSRRNAADAPAAPANAPRWAENPNTYSDSYWLLPRAKWATVGFWAIGAAVLMDLASSQQLIAAGNAQWGSQLVSNNGEAINQTGREMALIGATGIMVLGTLIFMSYVAMPPRTTIVKNGIMQDANNNRRTSISHNAETRLGPNAV